MRVASARCLPRFATRRAAFEGRPTIAFHRNPAPLLGGLESVPHSVRQRSPAGFIPRWTPSVPLDAPSARTMGFANRSSSAAFGTTRRLPIRNVGISPRRAASYAELRQSPRSRPAWGTVYARRCSVVAAESIWSCSRWFSIIGTFRVPIRLISFNTVDVTYPYRYIEGVVADFAHEKIWGSEVGKWQPRYKRPHPHHQTL